MKPTDIISFLPDGSLQPVQCEVIRIMKRSLYVEVIDERKPNGKRIFHNTDTLGSTLCISPSQIVN